MQKHLLFFFFGIMILISCKKNSNNLNQSILNSSEKKITYFSFDSSKNISVLSSNIIGDIINDTIELKVEQGTILTNIIPTIVFSGSSISPNQNVEQNFNNQIKYSVVANDGSTKIYNIKILLIKINKSIFFGSNDGNLYALNAKNGNLLWKYTTGSAIQNTPTISNQTIFFGSNNQKLYALNSNTGILKWSYTTNHSIGGISPTVSNGNVFIASSNNFSGGLYALNELNGNLIYSNFFQTIPYSITLSGNKLFLTHYSGASMSHASSGLRIGGFTGPNVTRTNPAIYNGRVVISSSNGLFCFDTSNFNQVWRVNIGTTVSSPTVFENLIYVGGAGSGIGHSMYCLDANTGVVKWSTTPDPNAVEFTSPTITSNLVFSTNKGYLFAYRILDGSLLWRKTPQEYNGEFTYATAANGVIYCGNVNKKMYAFEANTGAVLWSFITLGEIYSGPCVTHSDGNVSLHGSSGSQN